MDCPLLQNPMGSQHSARPSCVLISCAYTKQAAVSAKHLAMKQPMHLIRKIKFFPNSNITHHSINNYTFNDGVVMAMYIKHIVSFTLYVGLFALNLDTPLMYLLIGTIGISYNLMKLKVNQNFIHWDNAHRHKRSVHYNGHEYKKQNCMVWSSTQTILGMLKNHITERA